MLRVYNDELHVYQRRIFGNVCNTFHHLRVDHDSDKNVRGSIRKLREARVAMMTAYGSKH